MARVDLWSKSHDEVIVQRLVSCYSVGFLLLTV